MADNVKLFGCKLITPERTLFDGETDFVIFKSMVGDMGVLAGHEPMTAPLGDGLTRVFVGDDELLFGVFGGFAEVGDDGNLTLLSDDAKRPDEIDPERAKRSRESAERIIREEKDALEVRKAELQMRRAQVSLEVSAFPMIRGRHGDS